MNKLLSSTLFQLGWLTSVLLGAAVFPDMFLAIAVLGLGWGILVLMLTHLAVRHGGFRVGPEKPAEVVS